MNLLTIIELSILGTLTLSLIILFIIYQVKKRKRSKKNDIWPN